MSMGNQSISNDCLLRSDTARWCGIGTFDPFRNTTTTPRTSCTFRKRSCASHCAIITCRRHEDCYKVHGEAQTTCMYVQTVESLGIDIRSTLRYERPRRSLCAAAYLRAVISFQIVTVSLSICNILKQDNTIPQLVHFYQGGAVLSAPFQHLHHVAQQHWQH